MRDRSSSRFIRPLVFLPLLGALVTGCVEDRVYPPHYGVYLAIVLAAEVEGVLGPTDPGPSKLALVRPFVAGPQLHPEYIDGQGPPFCVGFQFGPTMPPNVVNADAGRISLRGFGAVPSFIDISMGPTAEPQPFPSEISCDRQPVGETLPYNCNIPPVAMTIPPGTPWIDGSTAITIDVSGGENVGGFSQAGITPAPRAMPSDPMALYAVDPAGTTIAWEPVSAQMVMIELIGQSMDGSAGAQILCLEPADSGMKEIPADALALLPAASDTNPLIIQTNLVALNLRQGSEGWGSYMVGAGRGSVGITCRISSGLCPPTGM